jgi:hypothetical protein
MSLEAKHVPKQSAQSFSNLLRDIIQYGNGLSVPSPCRDVDEDKRRLLQNQYEEWASLGFTRAVASGSPDLCRQLATRPWIDLLFRIVEAKEVGGFVTQTLPTQVHALRMLQALLPHATSCGELMAQVQERLFHLLGHCALMCRVDGAHFGDQGLLQKIRRGRGTRVALTAPHSSAIVEESVRLVRNLHALPKWAARINDFICLKLSLISEIVAEIPILQMQLMAEEPGEGENFLLQQSSIVASLSVIGGFDSRPYLGGHVISDGGARGVVCRIGPRGRLLVQMLKDNCLRKMPFFALQSMCGNSFRISQFTKHEDALRVATSLLSLLAQDFRIERDKWRMLSDNSDSINMALLRQQQQRLAIIKAARIFFRDQNILRHILKQPVSTVLYA